MAVLVERLASRLCLLPLQGIVLVPAAADDPQEVLQELALLGHHGLVVEDVVVDLCDGGQPVAHHAVDGTGRLLGRGGRIADEILPEEGKGAVGETQGLCAGEKHPEGLDEGADLQDELVVGLDVVNGLHLVGGGVEIEKEVGHILVALRSRDQRTDARLDAFLDGFVVHNGIFFFVFAGGDMSI